MHYLKPGSDTLAEYFITYNYMEHSKFVLVLPIKAVSGLNLHSNSMSLSKRRQNLGHHRYPKNLRL